MYSLKPLVIILLAFAIACWGQGQQQQQQVALTQQIVEDLLQVLSGGCKAELEGAIESQQALDLSYDCKVEIQRNLQQMGHVPQQAGPGYVDGEYDSEADPMFNEDGEGGSAPSKATKPVQKPLINPMLGIAGFVIVSVVALAILVNYVNKQVGDRPAKKPLSKKKV